MKVNNFSGFVERIGLRSTRVRTTDRTVVVVPNKQMVDSIVDNWSQRNLVRNEIRVELAPQTLSEKIQIALDEIKKIFSEKEDNVLNTTIFLQEISKNSALIFCEYFTSSAMPAQELNKLKEDLNLAIKETMEQNEIQMAVANSFNITTTNSQNES